MGKQINTWTDEDTWADESTESVFLEIDGVVSILTVAEARSLAHVLKQRADYIASGEAFTPSDTGTTRYDTFYGVS